MNIIYKVKNFLKSLFWHAYSGFPKSDQNLINERYNICLSCEMFDTKNSQCLICGCNISNRKEFMNKVAWRDQSCPKNKW